MVSHQREKFLRVKPPLPKSDKMDCCTFICIAWFISIWDWLYFTQFVPLCLIPLVFVYLFIFFPGVLLPKKKKKIHAELFIHMIEYVMANSEGLTTQKSVIKIKNFNRAHRKISADFMKSIFLYKGDFKTSSKVR